VNAEFDGILKNPWSISKNFPAFSVGIQKIHENLQLGQLASWAKFEHGTSGY
jgi:hypothetical protein